MKTLLGLERRPLTLREWIHSMRTEEDCSDISEIADFMERGELLSDGMREMLGVLSGRLDGFSDSEDSYAFENGVGNALGWLESLCADVEFDCRYMRKNHDSEWLKRAPEIVARSKAVIEREEEGEREERMKRTKRLEISMDFDGSLVITDPCYLSEGMEFLKPDGNIDFDACDRFIDGIRGIQADTIYGDWSCTVFEAAEPHGALGEFCADGSMVCVTTMEEMDARNPLFRKWAAEHDWCVAVIPGFRGTATIFHDFKKYVDKDTGRTELDSFCALEGHGTVDFVAGQTGF